MTANFDGQYEENSGSSSKSCLWGCGGCVGCLSLIVVALLAFGYYAVDKLLPTKPLPAGTFTATTEEIDTMKKRLAELKESANDDEQKSINFSFDEREFNTIGIIAMEKDPEIQVLDAEIVDDSIKVRFSLKNESNGGRYLNITYKGQFSLTETSMNFNPEQMQIGEINVMEYVQGEDQIQQAEMEGKVREALAKIRRQHGVHISEASIKNGKIVVKAIKVSDAEHESKALENSNAETDVQQK
ncbi:MAG: hypothetical protein ACYTFY_00275 [Planctomycetota bacterium]|jgi:hypothetical protein